MTSLPRTFFDRDAREVAIDLLGRHLVRTSADVDPHPGAVATIVETEAYLGSHDLACHACRGRTPRTATMFGPPGRAYVYLIYGMYHCLNAVTGPDGTAGAVLIRAVFINDDEPSRQGRPYRGTGPGRLTRALDVTRRHDAADLSDPSSPIQVLPGPRPIARANPDQPIRRGPRIGVDSAGPEWAAKPLRFWLDSHFAVSGTRKRNQAGEKITG
ncbi:putative 3-methyladenine DNA glycosylase [Chloroflexota bacterium]|nr:putative 3-methyladenine DNA glycosylase [Chloroflexota bacterium]